LGTFAAWEKYLAAAQRHNNKHLPQGGEEKIQPYVIKGKLSECCGGAKNIAPVNSTDPKTPLTP